MIRLEPEQIGRRFDQYSDLLGVKTRSRLQQLIKSGAVKLNGELALGSTIVSEGDVITFAEKSKSKVEVAIKILYEDDEILALHKPSGLLMHARGNEDDEYTVVDFMRSRTQDTEPDRPGIIHRLDRETSGVVLTAKTTAARERFQVMFADRVVKKQYRAICEGLIKDEKARFEWPIERHPKKPYSFRVGVQGKPATTRMQVLSHGKKGTEVHLFPLTGRTHQLRVHMEMYGHPIAGDVLYGRKKKQLVPLLLHAEAITFKNSQGEEMTVTSPPEWRDVHIAKAMNG